MLFCGSIGYAQNFTLQATPTEVTCSTAGSLTFSVENAIPGVPINYNVYILPDIANPVAQTTNNTVTGLSAANYYITATQNSGGNEVSAIAQTTIEDNSQLAFSIINTTPLCPAGIGSFTVNVTSGTPATYEILDLPTLFPPQASPDFTNVPPGYYGITVTDICGSQVTEYRTIAQGDVFGVGVARKIPGMYLNCEEEVETSLLLIADPEMNMSPMPYPLTVEYTVHPPDGSADVVIEQVITSGDMWRVEVIQTLPYAIRGEYLDVDIWVEYPCGRRQHTAFGSPPGQPKIYIPEMEATGNNMPAECAQKYLNVVVENLTPPYTITFNSYPESFVPELYNTNYPGPYTVDSIDFGSYDMPAPKGFYRATITDACGATKNVFFTLTSALNTEYSSYNYDCVNNLGGLNANLIANDGVTEVNLTTAIMTSAPENYEFEPNLPLDVSAFINNDNELELTGLPPGNYGFKLSDQCNNTLTQTIQVRPFVPSVMVGDTRPDCTPGFGTVKIDTHNPPLTGVRITRAPEGFPYELPYDVSFNVTDGVFYMDNVPAGSYAFMGIDACYNPEFPRYYSVIISGYQVTRNNLQVIPGCNSYDIILDYLSNAPEEKFWLQKKITPGSWGHPVTGELYTEGSVPTAQNAMAVTISDTISANGWSGNYRILRHYQTYGSGIPVKDCMAQLHTFDLYQGLQLLETNILSCPDDPVDLEVVSNGTAPVIYTITHRNGIPYLIQNGENNIFTDLEPAVYTLNITDSCGRFINPNIDIQAATPLIVVNDPGVLFACDEANDGTDVFNLPSQNAGILGTQDPNEYTVTYHITQEDADAGTAALPDSYTTEPRTVYARVIRNDTPGCFKTIAFELQLYDTPVLNVGTPAAFCPGQSVTLNAPRGFVSYRWSNGVTTPDNTVSAEGNYILTVTNANGCQVSQTIAVIESPVPEIDKVDIDDFGDNNSITVTIKPTAQPMFPEYSLDGITFQESNVFENLSTGIYTVYVRDQFRCGFDHKTVYLLMYPKYFTPNGDGVNDTWFIKYSTAAEPGLTVQIYDRFGKLIEGFNSNSRGWDGTLNGTKLPADDYWFMVRRQNGEEYRGHFSLIR
ncbi:T9SS type B sorting domain-containing protein [Flavobacterium sp. Sd200]|uniref:T9SS type B sorting domain-containing protein n=1 Tax=Flavobacterium sp. Sd200 TaxID=2692211 RepID=UPI00136C5B81|nr:T9SS type B sorting domain-containing protein [Flavobacterium sp. Sd200]MXN92364.1 T9SS type B sorting domain-containing protein [Flavobacterium sp. Sd200]